MKQKTKGRKTAVIIMLVCIVLSIPLGMHTTMARKDDAAVEAFYGENGETSLYDLLAADVQLGENLVRNSKVLLSDMEDDSNYASLQLTQQEMSAAYQVFAGRAGSSASGRAGVEKLVDAYNDFSGAMLRWLDAADVAIAGRDGDYKTYETFRDKFRSNHNAILYSSYNVMAKAFNLYFEEPVVRTLRWVSFTGPLPLFLDEEIVS